MYVHTHYARVYKCLQAYIQYVGTCKRICTTKILSLQRLCTKRAWFAWRSFWFIIFSCFQGFRLNCYFQSETLLRLGVSCNLFSCCPDGCPVYCSCWKNWELGVKMAKRWKKAAYQLQVMTGHCSSSLMYVTGQYVYIVWDVQQWYLLEFFQQLSISECLVICNLFNFSFNVSSCVTNCILSFVYDEHCVFAISTRYGGLSHWKPRKFSHEPTDNG